MEQRPDSGREEVRPLGEDEGIRRRALAQSRTVPSCVLAHASVSVSTHTYGGAARLRGLGPGSQVDLKAHKGGLQSRRGLFMASRIGPKPATLPGGRESEQSKTGRRAWFAATRAPARYLESDN